MLFSHRCFRLLPLNLHVALLIFTTSVVAASAQSNVDYIDGRSNSEFSLPGIDNHTDEANAVDAISYLIANCVCKDKETDFWKNPGDKNGLGSDQNGWQGAQAVQPLIIMSQFSKDRHYIRMIRSYASWVRNNYPGRNNLSLCQTWPGYDTTACKPVGTPPSHFCIWSDDSGWVINSYLHFYHVTKDHFWLNIANQTFLNADKQWGVNFKDDCRGFRYYDHLDGYTMYTSAYILAGLTLYQDLKNDRKSSEADQDLGIVSEYYNFIEDYLHSSGIGTSNATGTSYGMPQDLYEVNASFKAGCMDPVPDANSYLKNDYFTGTHMMMTAVYVLLSNASRSGADMSRINSRDRNFDQRATAAADAFISYFPEGYVVNIPTAGGSVLIDAADPNVNGFGCYWWVKYVVPLNPEKYGDVIIRTAHSIVQSEGTHDISLATWFTPNPSLPRGSYKSPDANVHWWVMVRDASACSILSAAAWLEAKYGLQKQSAVYLSR